jgi:hypothetical protein
VGALAIYVLGSVPLLILNVTTMRYEHDFADRTSADRDLRQLEVLAAPLSPAARRAIAWLYGCCAVSTIVGGSAARLHGYFSTSNATTPPSSAPCRRISASAG